MTAKERHELNNVFDVLRAKVNETVDAFTKVHDDLKTVAGIVKGHVESIANLTEFSGSLQNQINALTDRMDQEKTDRAALEVQVQDLTNRLQEFENDVSNLRESKVDRPWRELR
jgi:chromosome segregation ATPase